MIHWATLAVLALVLVWRVERARRDLSSQGQALENFASALARVIEVGLESEADLGKLESEFKRIERGHARMGKNFMNRINELATRLDMHDEHAAKDGEDPRWVGELDTQILSLENRMSDVEQDMRGLGVRMHRCESTTEQRVRAARETEYLRTRILKSGIDCTPPAEQLLEEIEGEQLWRVQD